MNTGQRSETVARRRAVKPSYGEPAGYVILTAQPDGSWSDDWDGEVHVDFAKAEASYRDAVERLGEGSDQDYLMLCELIHVEVVLRG